ncbi:GNAT family acetyltransferase [Clostridium sp. K25]|uniref:Pseudaminic acid biosynthesis N-acetyl transferase n=1 Tax=Clostridium botulinum D str. 1873 TaxID=592027 RepID=A0A9P2G7S0_CLOBO|nr:MULTISPECIES: UDP-4-amino-4,6-dideoxy-N-acetyl-beta-L-altrosamine N-acetyltransferase [Clostridium]AYF55027.1 UDP-4-amino-4,6-dideoxy-N-acetyl-beta-L-altrosamine N-acetyltransferase [Clostridium novyi]EES91515.1 pseudaminic acid biosynthesis N-acetyl transferase [Clostridium botulinum D str. 1873]KEI10671.1 GNAT family acetyltransferase [Clostridium sp. K25]MCD3244461.1 UDP-4-amino-4,6-dideoxy-N-acetyl-beta-L-altrosamine N-acetyltransferase [Clostridium botulinum C]MCD3261020.1 UDP-4-amino-
MSLKLKKILKEDLNLVAKWRMSEEVTKYMYTDPQITEESQLIWYHSILNDDKVKYWIIEFKDVKIGALCLNDIDYINKKCYWGYYIGDTSFRGKGIAKMLECNIYDYIFFKLNLNKLCTEVFSFNEKVVKIHEKYGSQIEGILKQHILKNGKYYDVVRMGMTKDRWQLVKNNIEYEKIYIEEQ